MQNLNEDKVFLTLKKYLPANAALDLSHLLHLRVFKILVKIIFILSLFIFYFFLYHIHEGTTTTGRKYKYDQVFRWIEKPKESMWQSKADEIVGYQNSNNPAYVKHYYAGGKGAICCKKLPLTPADTLLWYQAFKD